MSSSRRDLTRAVEFAQEAVQLDATNPRAAIQAYSRSVALLSEVIERRVRSSQARSAASREEVRRLQTIVRLPFV